MKALGMASRLSVLVVLLLMSYSLGRPLYLEIESRWKGVIMPPDDPTSELAFADQKSSGSDMDNGSEEHLSRNGELTTNLQGVQQDNQQSGNVSRKGTGQNSEKFLDKSEQVQNPNGNFKINAGTFSRNDKARPLHEDLKRNIWEVPLAGSVMPPLEEFSLRKEMIEFRAKKNVIAVTIANHAFVDFVLTWVKSLTDSGVTNLLVGAMDMKLLEELYWAGIPTFDIGSTVKTVDVGWGTSTFHEMGREKVVLVNAFLSLEYELLMCDADMVWLRNPFPFMKRHPEADVLTSSDAVINSVDDERLEMWQFSNGAYNIGINHWRPTAAAKKFAAEWMEFLLSDDKVSDHQGFNELMRRTMGPSVDESHELFWAYDDTLKLGILPISIFCNGHTFFAQALYKELGLQPYAIHTTFQYAGIEGKRHRLREAKMFYDPPDYYDVPGGYLSYIPSLPENLMKGGAHTVQSHFNLVNHQLVQIRSALAIASILNRTLVMPELWCRFDRMWFGHPGIFPGTHTKQPFLCPMDHIFDINMWLTDLPNEQFGPAIKFREYSFLDNPQLPNKVKTSTLRVKLCDLGTPGCNDTEPSNELVPEAFRLPMNSTEDQLKAALSQYTEARVIEFSSMLGAFGNFSDEARAIRFSSRIKTYTDIWCCLQDVKPGHIWYDIYWDEKPDWKPRPPGTPDDDHKPF